MGAVGTYGPASGERACFAVPWAALVAILTPVMPRFLGRGAALDPSVSGAAKVSLIRGSYH